MKIIEDLRYNKIIRGITLFFALLISFWIPQYKFVLSMFISFLLLFSILQANYKSRFIENYSKERIVFFLIQISFFLLIIFGYFISDAKDIAGDIIIKKLSFLVFPLIFIFSGKQFAEKKHLFLKLFIAGNIIASVICIVYAFYQSLELNEGGGLLFNLLNEDGNSYFSYSLFSVFHHPAYFSMYIVFSIASLFYIKRHSDFIKTSKRKIVFYLIILYFLIIIFFLSSRAGMFTTSLIIIWMILLFIKKHKSFLFKILSLIFILAGIIILSQNKRVIRTYNEVKNIYIKGKEYRSYPARLFLWEASIKVIKDNVWLGTGTGDALHELSKKTKTINFRDEKYNTLNAHNQFLETFMSSGLIGFIVLLMIFLYSFYSAIKAKDELFILFLILIIINFLFESMLNTIAGIVFFCYFLNYFIFVHSVVAKKD